MKMIIETFVTIIFLSIAVILVAQVIESQITINQANDFHMNAVQVIEESNFNSEVIQACITEAELLGYTLNVSVNQESVSRCTSCNSTWDLQENTECPVCGNTSAYMDYISNDGIVTLDYIVELPMLGISQEGTLEANAR